MEIWCVFGETFFKNYLFINNYNQTNLGLRQLNLGPEEPKLGQKPSNMDQFRIKEPKL